MAPNKRPRAGERVDELFLNGVGQVNLSILSEGFRPPSKKYIEKY
jgi:hypothetical protein